MDTEEMMFTTLVESRAVRQRSISGTITSVALHAAVIAAAVGLSVTSSGRATEAPVETPVRFHPVRPAVVPRAVRTSDPLPAHSPQSVPAIRSITVPVDIPTTIPAIDFTAPPIGDEAIIITRGPGGPGTKSLGPALPGAPGDAVDEALVERAPRMLGTPPSPRYPSALRESGVSGTVVLRFVIDTLGRAEQGGVVVLESTHPLFAEAVKNVLPSFRFSPGEIAGRKIRTLVQLPFTFTVR